MSLLSAASRLTPPRTGWRAALIALVAASSASASFAGLLGSGAAALGLLPVADCALAPYPSPAWSACEARNVAATGQNPLGAGPLTTGVVAETLAYQKARAQALLADPERRPNPNPCTTVLLCPVDPRLQRWKDHDGLVEPVLYTSRSGATISGHIWATRTGPAKRPGVVIVNGSIVGFEQIYWFAAQALAKAGFVVMTFDAQGEGNSDQFGAYPDQLEAAFAGTPGLGFLGPKPAAGPGLGGNGLPFYDGGADALDFMLSTPTQPYQPEPSRTSGTSHADKQARRVAAGLNAGHNPLHALLDGSRIGLAGHSYGAVAASWLAQHDPRVRTAVAWDSLCVPVSPAPDEIAAFTAAPVNRLAGAVPGGLLYGLPVQCFGAPAGPAPAITKPALGLNGDYLAAGIPYLTPPRPQEKAAASFAYSAAGVDTGNITVRAGTHFDFNDVPLVLPASRRGIDLVTWYTVAWFAKYLQNDPLADRMLMSTRWQNDAAAAKALPAGEPNVYSWHYRSRLSITQANGQRFQCEDLRKGCAGQVPAANDCGATPYAFATVATGPTQPATAACTATAP